MADDRWMTVALPLIEYFGELERTGGPGLIELDDIESATGIDARLIQAEITRLIGAGYLGGDLDGDSSRVGWSMITNYSVAERGARAIGAWPMEGIVDDLRVLLSQAIEEAPTEAEKSKLRSLLSATGEVAQGTIQGVLTALITHRIGL